MKRLLMSLMLPTFLLACVPQGADAPDVASGISTDALATDAISAQPLDAALPGNAQNPTDSEASGPAVLETLPQTAQPPTESPALSDLTTEPAADQAVDGLPQPEAEPKPPASPEEAACVKKGGLWIHAGRSIAFTCVKVTRDSGQQCRKSSDCQGSCLARSMTCAPYDPLFGCNEILQDDGVRVTLCID